MKNNEELKELELLDAKEAAKLLKISVSSLRRLYYHNQIPHVKIGGVLRFEKKLIADWILSQTRGKINLPNQESESVNALRR